MVSAYPTNRLTSSDCCLVSCGRTRRSTPTARIGQRIAGWATYPALRLSRDARCAAGERPNVLPLGMREYDEIAEWFTATRSPTIGVPDLTALAQTLPPHARVLDLGCGDGIPVSRLLLREGFDLTALDSSPEMVRRYRINFPDVPTQCVRVQDAHFAPASFEAVVAWGVLFHLSETEQATAIRKVSEWVRPGGRFLFTSGDTQGVAESDMNGVAFRYTSLGIGAYRRLLEGAGMRLEHHYADAWGNYVYVAATAAEPATAGGQHA